MSSSTGYEMSAPLSDKEEREHAKLSRLWATGRASRRQIERCMELDRRIAPPSSQRMQRWPGSLA